MSPYVRKHMGLFLLLSNRLIGNSRTTISSKFVLRLLERKDFASTLESSGHTYCPSSYALEAGHIQRVSVLRYRKRYQSRRALSPSPSASIDKLSILQMQNLRQAKTRRLYSHSLRFQTPRFGLNIVTHYRRRLFSIGVEATYEALVYQLVSGPIPCNASYHTCHIFPCPLALTPNHYFLVSL